MHAEARANLDRCQSCKHFRHERFMEVSCEIATAVVTILDTTTCPLHGGDVPQAERVESVPLTIAATSKAALTKPVPRAEWPMWANAIAKLATDADKGVGDIVDRELGRLGVAFKATMKAIGVPCGCNARKVEWNAKFPLNN